MNSAPIAVFDSGLGGLSVVRQLRRRLPHEHIVYFGDTARVPYGTKSRATVSQFALDDARFLLQFHPKLVVAACNTASALAMDDLTRSIPVPVIGVVEPGARAAVAQAQGGAVGILGTEATINSGAYPNAIVAAGANIDVVQRACPLFVPLVEEGRDSDDPIVRLAVETYLKPLRERNVRVVVLGCTHYPLIRPAIEGFLGPEVCVVDSGQEAAASVEHVLERCGQLSATAGEGNLRCYVSDNPTRFGHVGSRFLGHSIEHVEFVEPERYIGG